MPKTAAIFSGQGSQYTGMGQGLIETYPEAKQIYECAGDILGMDIAGLSATAEVDALSRTAIAQPVIYTLSVAAYTVAASRFPRPDCVLGHSLGEFAALYAAGAYNLEDGFRIIGARAKAMEDAVREAKPGAMFAILGSVEGTVAAICRQTEGFVLPVNLNLPSQTVISGETTAAEQAAEALTAAGAKAVRLGVGSAFHTTMMQPAADQFRQQIANIAFHPTEIPFYSNLTGDKHAIEDYPGYFAQHMTSPVRFVEQIAAILRDGISACVEYGPKKTAATLAKKNARSLAVTNVEDPAGIEALAAFYEKL